MKSMLSRLSLVSLALAMLLSGARAKELSELTLLYVGEERTEEYVAFLKSKVARMEARSRKGFDPAGARGFDVVVLDWPQSGGSAGLRALEVPLGRREDWARPTVLLGSAGLNLAVAWQMKGGGGCTCMDPVAYDLREHEIFERPFALDRGRLVSIPTPTYFRAEITESHIKVLPLVDDITRSWKSGWCTYSTDFAAHPDVEFFCGGVNHKTPTAAGLWRQGNFLHFGFEQSPGEMNEQGRLLLLNAIAYISRFTEDRPIATTPSIFAGKIARPRSTPARWLRDGEPKVAWVRDMMEPGLWAKISPMNREDMAAWFDHNQSFLRPGSTQQLELDDDLVALGLAFDHPEFFERMLAGLGSGEAASAGRARRLLERYVPEGPPGGDVGAWSEWWGENRAYVFASDTGDYRWYVDPLAKKRRIPTRELRGPARADAPAP